MHKEIYSFWCIFFLISSCNNIHTHSENYQKILGRQLFFDNQLSYNNTKSCATCHDPKFAFTDGYKQSIGIYGDILQRNSRPLFNLSEQYYFTAADSTIHSLEVQMNNPLLHQNPPELGWYGREQELAVKLRQYKTYQHLFNEAFPGDKEPVNYANIKKAIAAFVRSIKSYNSPYDKFIKGDTAALNGEEKKGMQLFFSNKTNCSQCHGGKNFNTPAIPGNYFNTGIYNTDAKGSYPVTDKGLMELTKQPADMGKYRVPTLRNLLFTAPYYHDGSEEQLQKVIAAYNSGGRIIITGQYKGDGSANPYKHPLIKPLGLSEQEQRQLLLFLYTLSDSTVLRNPKWTAPIQR